MSGSEYHLFIIWANAEHALEKICDDIKANFQLLSVRKYAWTKRIFGRNLSRFYGQKLPSKRGKIKETGTGAFHVIFLRDQAPKYEWRETSRGSELVNAKMFDAKKAYRNWTGGGHKVHGTISELETNHDILFLTGNSPKEYAAEVAKYPIFDCEVCYSRDPEGAFGWTSLDQVFRLLNSRLNYLVLRNFEEISQKNFRNSLHGDLDLLVESLNETVLLLNAVKKNKYDHRVNYEIKVDGTLLDVDIRHVGDGYYCDPWYRDMLRTRILSKSGYYRPNNLNYFYSLVYHAFIHKRKSMAVDYPKKLNDAFEKINRGNDFANYRIEENDLSKYFLLLGDFMQSKSYYFTRPKDRSVYFDNNLARVPELIYHLENNYPLADIVPYMLNRKSGSNYIMFTAIEKNSDCRVMIKVGGVGQSVKNEYFAMKSLNMKHSKSFPEPLFYAINNRIKMVCFKFTEGQSLHEILAKCTLSKLQAQKIINAVIEINKFLSEQGIVHRDIKPSDFIINSDFEVRLVDFQFSVAVSGKELLENKFAIENFRILDGLGGDFRKGKLCWDDGYSINKIIKLVAENAMIRDYPKASENILIAYYKPPGFSKLILSKLLSIFLNKRARNKINTWKMKGKLRFKSAVLKSKEVDCQH